MKALKTVNSLRNIHRKNLLGLIVISGFLAISLFACNQETPTPEASKPTGSVAGSSPKPSPSQPISQTAATTTTAKPSPSQPVSQAAATTTTAKPSPTTTTAKPSPTTATPQANESPANNLPKPNAKGDYSRTYHKFWQIVDTSGKGVSCRMGKATIEEIQTPEFSGVLDISSWPVIGNFKQGQSFEINLGPAGFGILPDTKKEPWIFVEKTSEQGAPTKCFVRANSSFVKPISPK